MNTGSQPIAQQPDSYVAEGVLVDADWLEARLDDPAVRVVEVDVSAAAYDDWHIEGAVLWNIYADLKDNEYRLVDCAALEQLFSGSGIHTDTTVVFYGYAPALGLWLMKLYGHRDVHILDCSRDSWRANGRPWSTAPTEPDTSKYFLSGEDHGIRAHHTDVDDAIGRQSTTLVDVRTEPEYRGERFWPSGALEPNGRVGHVPSAIHQPMDGLHNDDGSYRAATDLRAVFSNIDLDGDHELITYCTIGGRAATTWFVLTYLLGREHVRVYDGSWAEWGRMPNARVEQA